MNQYLQNIGVGLIGKVIDFGVAKLTSPHRTSPEQRIEQIDKLLETLESAPADAQRPARPPIEALESQKPEALASSATIATHPAETAPEKEAVATACVPCAVGHFSTSAGLLKEAVRFKAEGITSNEVLDRIAMALEEQNTLERVDIRPEVIQSLPPWERALAEEALLQSRQLRHNLETLQNIGQLERAAADSEGIYKKLFREWFKQCFAHLGPEKAEMIAAKVGKPVPPEVLADYPDLRTRGGNPDKGLCYEEAWRFLIKQEEGELIHGSVQTIGKRINHAWVELPTGYVWEPESGEFMKKSHFYERAEPIEEHRYNVEEAAIMLARVGKHGPWTDEERARWLHREQQGEK